MTGRASKGINPTKPELKLYLRFCGIAAEPLEILSVRFRYTRLRRAGKETFVQPIPSKLQAQNKSELNVQN